MVLGGGHEAAFGHYLGYVSARKKVGIVNLDAHLDVRPLIEGKGHSGSPFRQAIKNDSAPLPRGNYYCLGVQPHTMAREHLDFMREHDCKISWASEVEGNLGKVLQSCHDRVAGNEHLLFVSLDADVVRMADMPGVSSPNPTGLSGTEVLAAARIAGALPKVTSFEIVEINPRFDRDGQSARWAALAVWNFLIGLASRGSR